MGRGNTLARVARAKERLELAAQAQAEIAKQVVDAIDNGADPELVVGIAEKAAKEIDLPSVTINPALEEQNRQKELQEKNRQDRNSFASQEKVTIKVVNTNIVPVPNLRTGSTMSGKQYRVLFNADGIAVVAKEIADHLVEHSNGKFAYVEE